MSKITYKGQVAEESQSLLANLPTRRIRKSLPKHLGRRTKEEREKLKQQRSIHNPRNLRKMLLQTNLDSNLFGTNEAFVDNLLVTFRHWLMDVAHERRMADQIDEQDTIERVIEMMGEKQ